MIVDIVGVLAHQSEEFQSWQKITVKELRPSTSSPRDNNPPQREGCLPALVVCDVSDMELYFYIEFIN